MSAIGQPAPYPFRRTICDCRLCSISCEHLPGALAPRDVPLIADHLGHADPADFASQRLLVSDGPRLKLAGGRVISLPTLVPESDASGACVFLDRGRCTIHAVSPFGCSHIDAHLPEAEFRRRADTLYAEILDDRAHHGPYTRLIDEIGALGRLAPPIADRKARLADAMHREGLTGAG